MKNLITKTVMAAGVVAVMGATYAVAGGASDENTFVQNTNYSTTEMMTTLGTESNTGLFGGVKAVLSPVKDYVMNAAYETTSCIIVNGVRF